MKTFTVVCLLLVAAGCSIAAPQTNGNDAYNQLLDQFQQTQDNFNVQQQAFHQQFQELFNQQANLANRGNFGGAGAFSSSSGGVGHSVGVSSGIGTRFGDADDGKPQFFSVTATRFSHDVDSNGMKTHKQGGKTIVNNNGKITEYPNKK